MLTWSVQIKSSGQFHPPPLSLFQVLHVLLVGCLRANSKHEYLHDLACIIAAAPVHALAGGFSEPHL